MWRRLFLFSLSLFRVQFPPWMSSRFLWINMNSSPPNIVLTPENGVRTGRLHCPRPFRKPGFSHFFFQKRPLSPPHRRMEQAPVPRHSAGATGRKTPRTPGRKKAEPPGSGSAFLVIFSYLLGPPLCIQRQRPRPAAAGTQMTIPPSASILQGPMQSRYPECLSLPPIFPWRSQKAHSGMWDPCRSPQHGGLERVYSLSFSAESPMAFIFRQRVVRLMFSS